MLSPTYEITTALSHTDELISPPYDIAIVTISYGRVTMSSVWDSMMSKKNMGWPFYAAVADSPPRSLRRWESVYSTYLWFIIDNGQKKYFVIHVCLHDQYIMSRIMYIKKICHEFMISLTVRGCYTIKTSTVYWCIASKLKAARNLYRISNMFLWVEIFLFFVLSCISEEA